MTITLPNMLTMLRLLAAPGIALCFLALPRPAADAWALGIFVVASLTDYVDGYLARSLDLVTKLGTMLDPIADKAMVVIALAVLMHYSSLSELLILPVALILFREVFVSGLREYLGDTAGLLKVTKLAKWKTTAQMVAIAVLLAQGIAEHQLGEAIFGLDNDTVKGIVAGTSEDQGHLGMLLTFSEWLARAGVLLLWLAAALTVITGADYFLKARPHLKDE
ncbi:CDP-diacylglycerol--glycerol-3-phosphate 3-phosphatidyltransferase [Pseudooceanicola sp. HF7]|uniref:CDP-diacylglycerol--glycerol-3-phosphate 3-phosphatidyltransferase n=1 Tax=Pseudooceanicola sp. HF7 TaxID=2721560 RepID=UPI00142FA343|nr:CDP-diacylglycerol--glycerol-3-phosphate 3-phosphatidyltransferase [Pseudooceanicola sp. HF7]NIZ08278.1 CDP-diacylglycerol--glycerol-3-phosphate 3-phosphatidyltransferase [Pseudooceanicola sp. HF7]